MCFLVEVEMAIWGGGVLAGSWVGGEVGEMGWGESE